MGIKKKRNLRVKSLDEVRVYCLYLRKWVKRKVSFSRLWEKVSDHFNKYPYEVLAGSTPDLAEVRKRLAYMDFR